MKMEAVVEVVKNNIMFREMLLTPCCSPSSGEISGCVRCCGCAALRGGQRWVNVLNETKIEKSITHPNTLSTQYFSF